MVPKRWAITHIELTKNKVKVKKSWTPGAQTSETDVCDMNPIMCLDPYETFVSIVVNINFLIICVVLSYLFVFYINFIF